MTSLSSGQAHALFDILTSHQTLTEIEQLKHADVVATFGFPLQPDGPGLSSSPLLQTLLRSFCLDLPGLRDVSKDFWGGKIQPLAIALDDANLSESYDKGSVGIRRTLSTATASIIGYVVRGRLGGYPKRQYERDAPYDPSNPDDVVDAWDDFLQQVIYGDMLNKFFAKAAQTDKLSDHEPVVQAAHQYALIIFASLLHHNLIVEPHGQSMISLLSRVHNLTPYFLIRQTLRVGDAASMLKGMTQLLLAKMNMSALTSWFGGQVSDSGTNLFQQIISQVLKAEINEFRKHIKTIEQMKDGLSPKQLEGIRAYPAKPAKEQQSIRSKSETQSKCIIDFVLSDANNCPSLSEGQTKDAVQYLSMHLAIRDRERLTEVLCHHQPDLVTSSIRELVTAYEPVIRALHKAVDLNAGVADLQAFLDDLIKLSKVDPKTPKIDLPTVEDFCRLLQKHQGSSHRFINQAIKNGKVISEWYHEYSNHAAAQYKQLDKAKFENTSDTAAGDFTARLDTLVSNLSEEDRRDIIEELNHHEDFLSSLTRRSKEKMDRIVRSFLDQQPQKTQSGPGMFLWRWKQFINDTLITPTTSTDSLKHSKNDRDDQEIAGNANTDQQPSSDPKIFANTSDPSPPDTTKTIRLLRPGFIEILHEARSIKKA